MDPESGLHYNHFHYDPEPTRYLSQDPLGLAPAPNPATYVHHPHTWSDPLGLAPCPPGGPDKHLPPDVERGDVRFPDHDSALAEVLCRYEIEDPSYIERVGQGGKNPNLTWDHAGLRPLSQTERRTDTDDERFFAIVTDLIGTPTELVDESGTLAWRTRTTLWGTTTWNRDATAYTPLRFPGQYFDPESGLHYNYFRYYDPESARYLSQDPLGLAPAPNSVAYVSNPNTWADPLGLKACPDEDGKGKKSREIHEYFDT